MFSRLRGVSKVGLVAIGGLFTAFLGAFLGWVLFPFMVNLNVNKVNVFYNFIQIFLFEYIILFIWRWQFFLWFYFLQTKKKSINLANCDKRWNRTVRTLG